MYSTRSRISGTMSSLRLIPVSSSLGVFRSIEKMMTVFSPQKLLQQALVFLKVHDTVQFHVIDPAQQKPVLADKLLPAGYGSVSAAGK